MWLAYALLSALSMGLASFIITVATKRQHTIADLLFGLYFSGTVCFFMWIQMQASWEISYELLLAGALIGLGSLFGNIFFSKALLQGPASLTGPLANLNIVLVIIMSLCFFEESLSYKEMLAVTLLLCATIALPFDPNESLSVKNKQWYTLILLTIIALFALNGGLKFTQSLGFNNTWVLFYSYGFVLIGFIGYFLAKYLLGREVKMRSLPFKPQSLTIGFIAGIFSFIALQAYAYALETGYASIVVPIFASRGILVMMLCLWFFKEKMSSFQKISMACVFTGLCLVG